MTPPAQSEPPRPSVTVVLWSGEYKNDGLERMERLNAFPITALPGINDLWLQGDHAPYELRATIERTG